MADKSKETDALMAEEQPKFTVKPAEEKPAPAGKAEVSTFMLIGLLALVIGTQTVKDVYRSIVLTELLHNASIFALMTCILSMVLEFALVVYSEGKEGVQELWKGIPWWNMENLKAFGPCAPLFSLQKIPDTLAPVFILPGLASIIKQVNPLITNLLTPVIVGRTSSAKEWVAIGGFVATVYGFAYANGVVQAGGSSITLGALLVVLGRFLGAVGGLVSEKSMKKGGKKSVYMQKFWMDCCELPVGICFFFLMPYLLRPIDSLGIADTKLAEKEDYTILQANMVTITTPDASLSKLQKELANLTEAAVSKKTAEDLRTACAQGDGKCDASIKTFAERQNQSSTKPLKTLEGAVKDLTKKSTTFPVKKMNIKIKEGNYQNITLGAENASKKTLKSDPRQVFKMVQADKLWCVEDVAGKKKQVKDIEAGFLQTPATEAAKTALNLVKGKMSKYAEKKGAKQTVEHRCAKLLIANTGKGWVLVQKTEKKPEVGDVANVSEELKEFLPDGMFALAVLRHDSFNKAMNLMVNDKRIKENNTAERKTVPQAQKFEAPGLTAASLRFGDVNAGSQIDGSADTFVCSRDRCDLDMLTKNYGYNLSLIEKYDKAGALAHGRLTDYDSGAFLNMFNYLMILNALINAASNLVGAAVTKQLSAVWKALGQCLASTFIFWTFDFFFHSAEGGFYTAQAPQVIALMAMTSLLIVNTIFYAGAKQGGKH